LAATRSETSGKGAERHRPSASKITAIVLTLIALTAATFTT